jgi:DNA-binding transcriptional LysR family regulator
LIHKVSELEQLNFQALADFNLVARHEGFGKASRSSGRSKASLSRHVAELEEGLGVRLLERVGRSFRLTEEGKTLYNRTAGLLGEVSDAAQEVTEGRGEPRGRLRVSAPVTFGNAAMGRLAAEFAVRFPEVQLEVTVEDHAVDLIVDGYDVVIRVNPKPDDELVGRCFFRDRLAVVAAPSLAFPKASSGSDSLPSVPAVVGIGMPESGTWTLRNGEITQTIHRHAVLRLPNPITIRDAVIVGVGAAVLARNFIEDDIAQGRLVCWGEVPERAVEIWVLHSSRRLVSSKVAAFVRFLCDAYADKEVGLNGLPHVARLSATPAAAQKS